MAHDACGPEQDTIAYFPRRSCSAVSAFFKTGLGGALRGGCIRGLAKTLPYLSCSRTGLWSEVLKYVSQQSGCSRVAATFASPHLRQHLLAHTCEYKKSQIHGNFPVCSQVRTLAYGSLAAAGPYDGC